MNLLSAPEVTLRRVWRSIEEPGRTREAGESLTSGHMGTVDLGRSSVMRGQQTFLIYRNNCAGFCALPSPQPLPLTHRQTR